MPLTFHHTQLSNGLDVVAEINPDSYTFAAGLFVKTGARDEPAELMGVSHFLEHMMFKGSDKYTWADVNRIFDEMGADNNAFTSEEATGYYANVLPEFTDAALEHLAHLLRPAIRVEDFTMEKGVIINEIKRYLDEPGHRLYEMLMQTHFGEHPLSRSVLGTEETIARMTRDEMAGYFNSRYGPGSMVLSISGRLDFAETVRMAEKYMGHWPHVELPRRQAPPAHKYRRVDLTDPKLNRFYTMGMTDGPSAQDEMRFAARVLSDVIGDSDGSRFYWALVDNAIAEDADFGFYPHDGCGSFYISLTTSPDRSAEALQIARKELKRAKLDLADDEIERAKNKIASGLVLGGEIPAGRMRAIGYQWMLNREYRSLETDMATLTAVNRDSLVQLMEKYTFESMTIATLGPSAEPAKD